MPHIRIYGQPGRYAGWPANYGIWAWGLEVVAGFTLGYLEPHERFHARDRTRPFVTMQARTTDGGRRWEVEPFPARSPGGRGISADEHMIEPLGVAAALADPEAPGKPSDCPGGVRFDHPDLALMCGRTGLQPGCRSFFYHSYDRCRSWEGPFWLPDFGQLGVAARTDYIVSGAETCTLFLTVNKANGLEGRVLCARTTDGGATFSFRAWIGAEPEGFAIMPASLRLPDGRLLVAVRCRGGAGLAGQESWIDLYSSDDDALSWQYMGRPVAFRGRGHNGNPPTLTFLPDGRVCMTYGDRAAPYLICALLSGDGGRTWGEELVLREGAGNHDIGYPRTALLADGSLVTVYYWNDGPEAERTLEATVWQPNE